MSRDMTKPTKWLCAQRKLGSAQADLSLRWAHRQFAVFVMSRLISIFLLDEAIYGELKTNEPPRDKTNNMAVHPPSLIRVFAMRSMGS